jgi:hypothetical protein
VHNWLLHGWLVHNCSALVLVPFKAALREAKAAAKERAAAAALAASAYVHL